MNWLFEHQWYWIDAQDTRLNTRGTVSEWLTAPILLFFRTDYLVFLPNWISFLFFPSLIFQVWRDWGVSPRVAWIWMWLLPTAFCYSMQASNSSNDILATFFALAAFAFLRGGRKVPPVDLLASLLSAALMTGTKLTMAPLLVPWAIVMFPHVSICLHRPAGALAGIIWAALVSFLPTGVFNYLHYQDFSGLSPESYLQTTATYFERLVGNVFLIFVHNLIYSGLFEDVWSKQMIWASSVGKMIDHHFEEGALHIYPFYAVEQAGLGVVVISVGIYLFIVTFTVKYSRLAFHRLTSVPNRPALHLVVWILFLLFLLTSTSAQPARIISGYYPFLLILFFLGSIFPSNRQRRWTKVLVCSSVAVTAICLIYETENPLIETHQSFNWVRMFEEAEVSFINQKVPTSEKAIGLMRDWNQRESWAWQPYGSRRVYELSESPNPEQMKARGIHYVVITSKFVQLHSKGVTRWLETHPHVLVGRCLISKDQPMGDYLFYIP